MDQNEVIVLESTESDTGTESLQLPLDLSEDDIMVIDEDLTTPVPDDSGEEKAESSADDSVEKASTGHVEMAVDSEPKAGPAQKLCQTKAMGTLSDGILKNKEQTVKSEVLKHQSLANGRPKTIANLDAIESTGGTSCEISQQDSAASSANLGHMPCVTNPAESELPLPYSCKLCGQQTSTVKEWINHPNSIDHAELVDLLAEFRSACIANVDDEKESQLQAKADEISPKILYCQELFEATDGKIYCGSCCCEVVDLLAHVSSLDHDEAVVAVQYPNELVRIRKTSLSLFGLCPALYHFKLRQFLQNVLPPTEDSPLEMVRMNENEQFAAWRANRLKEIAALRQDKGASGIALPPAPRDFSQDQRARDVYHERFKAVGGQCAVCLTKHSSPEMWLKHVSADGHLRKAQIFERLERWDLFEALPADRESPFQAQLNAMAAAPPIGVECIVEEYEMGNAENFQRWSCLVCFTTSNIHKQLLDHLESMKHATNYLSQFFPEMKFGATSTKEKQEEIKRYAKQIVDGMGVQKIKMVQLKVGKDELIKLFPLLQSGSYASIPTKSGTAAPAVDDVRLGEMGDGVVPKVLSTDETQELLWCEACWVVIVVNKATWSSGKAWAQHVGKEGHRKKLASRAALGMDDSKIVADVNALLSDYVPTTTIVLGADQMIERYSVGSDKKPKLDILCLLCAERVGLAQFHAHVKSRNHVFQFVHYRYPNNVKELFCQKPPEGKQREEMVESFLAKQRIAAVGCKPMKVIRDCNVELAKLYVELRMQVKQIVEKAKAEAKNFEPKPGQKIRPLFIMTLPSAGGGSTAGKTSAAKEVQLIDLSKDAKESKSNSSSSASKKSSAASQEQKKTEPKRTEKVSSSGSRTSKDKDKRSTTSKTSSVTSSSTKRDDKRASSSGGKSSRTPADDRKRKSDTTDGGMSRPVDHSKKPKAEPSAKDKSESKKVEKETPETPKDPKSDPILFLLLQSRPVPFRPGESAYVQPKLDSTTEPLIGIEQLAEFECLNPEDNNYVFYYTNIQTYPKNRQKAMIVQYSRQVDQQEKGRRRVLSRLTMKVDNTILKQRKTQIKQPTGKSGAAAAQKAMNTTIAGHGPMFPPVTAPPMFFPPPPHGMLLPPPPGTLFHPVPPPIPHMWVGGGGGPVFEPDPTTQRDWSNKCDQFLQRVGGGAAAPGVPTGFNTTATSTSTKPINDRRLETENEQRRKRSRSRSRDRGNDYYSRGSKDEHYRGRHQRAVETKEKPKEKHTSAAESSINSLLDLLGGQVATGSAGSSGRPSRFGPPPPTASVAQEPKSVTDQLLQALLSGSASGGQQASTDELLLTLILQEHERQMQADKEQQSLVAALANTIQKYEQQQVGSASGAAFDYAYGRGQAPDTNLAENMAVETLLQAIQARQQHQTQSMASIPAPSLMMSRSAAVALPPGVAGAMDAKQKTRQQVEQRRQELLQRYDDVQRKITQKLGQSTLTQLLGSGGGGGGMGMGMPGTSTSTSTMGNMFNPFFGFGSAPGMPQPPRKY